LLGAGTPAQWPKAFTTSAGEDKRVYRIGHVDAKWEGSSGSENCRFFFPNETYMVAMSFPISISKTSEQLPVDPLLVVTRAAIGLGVGILMADKIKPSIRQAAAIALVAIGALAAAPWLVKITLGQINRPESEWGSRARLRSIRGDSGYTSDTDIY